ncbi:urease accessory protein UreD [uncultured Aureimonas sp.]|uniref:urease accessory protein UreD n=1 Tax=uncultured Aureimonas sp. TaxID=1604662 RepID=UPI0025DEE73F|nr:urease accessory protein UreD [uncultured Aureimonas sp.]
MTLLDDAPASTDTPFPAAPPPRLQRARGEARASVGPVPRGPGTRTAIRRLHQAGCLKLRFPRLADGECQAVVINTSGGLTGGDRLTLGFEVEPRGALTVTTQACERVYRSVGGAAEVDLSIQLGPEASLAYLPQETILFEGGRLSRRLTLDAATDSRFLLLESVILGRAAMGETVADGLIADRWRIRRDLRLILAEDLRLGGDIAALGREGATLGGGRAFSTLVWQGPDPAGMLTNVRAGLGKTEGASLVDGLLVVRVVAADGYALRKRLMPLIGRLAHAPLPLVWSM